MQMSNTCTKTRNQLIFIRLIVIYGDHSLAILTANVDVKKSCNENITLLIQIMQLMEKVDVQVEVAVTCTRYIDRQTDRQTDRLYL